MWKHGGGKKGANFVVENRTQTEKGQMDGIYYGDQNQEAPFKCLKKELFPRYVIPPSLRPEVNHCLLEPKSSLCLKKRISIEAQWQHILWKPVEWIRVFVQAVRFW
jgi:hypothetical protein